MDQSTGCLIHSSVNFWTVFHLDLKKTQQAAGRHQPNQMTYFRIKDRKEAIHVDLFADQL